MNKINTSKSQTLQFNIKTEGIDFNNISGTFILEIDNVHYGFPAIIENHVVKCPIPSLQELIKSKLKDGMTVNSHLDIFGEGVFLRPWNEEIMLSVPPIAEVSIYPELNRDAPLDDVQVNDQYMNATSATNVPMEEIDEFRDVDGMNPIEESVRIADTQRVFIPEKVRNKSKSNSKLSESEKDIALRYLYRKLQEVTKVLNSKQKPISKHGTITESARQIVASKKNNPGKKLAESILNKFDVKKYKDATDPKQQKQVNSKVKPKQFTESVKKPQSKRLAEVIQATTPTQKKTKVTVKPNDPISLMESVGMTSQKTQNIMLEKAKELGGEGDVGICNTLKKLLGIEQMNPYADQFEKISKMKQFQN